MKTVEQFGDWFRATSVVSPKVRLLCPLASLREIARGGQAGVVAIDSVSHQSSFQLVHRLDCASRPMVDTVNRVVIEASLKALGERSSRRHSRA